MGGARDLGVNVFMFPLFTNNMGPSNFVDKHSYFGEFIKLQGSGIVVSATSFIVGGMELALEN